MFSLGLLSSDILIYDNTPYVPILKIDKLPIASIILYLFIPEYSKHSLILFFLCK